MTTCTVGNAKPLLEEQDQFPVQHLQRTISQRCQSDQDLLPLEESLSLFRLILELYQTSPTVFGDVCKKTESEERLIQILADFWTTYFANKGSSRKSPLLLGTQFAGFLEQCIEHGLTGQLTSIMSRIRKYQYLQYTDGHALSNLFATQVKCFPMRDPRGRSLGIRFFEDVTRPITSPRLLSLFEQTICKLESQDVVLCLVLFLQRAAKNYSFRLHRDLAAKYHKHMMEKSIVTAVSFLVCNPCPDFFTPLEAILGPGNEDALAAAGETARYVEVQGEIDMLCEEDRRNKNDLRQDKLRQKEHERRQNERRQEEHERRQNKLRQKEHERRQDERRRGVLVRFKALGKPHDYSDPRSSTLTPLTCLPTQ